MKNASAQLLPQLREAEQRTEELKKTLVTMKKVYDLLPDAKENIEKLQDIADRSVGLLQQLCEEWEKHRAPLVAEMRSRRGKLHQRSQAANEMNAKIQVFQKEIGDLKVELDEKDRMHQKVLAILARLPDDLNREMFTDRIVQIITQLKKQQVRSITYLNISHFSERLVHFSASKSV
mgnify:CR=1 FL=1